MQLVTTQLNGAIFLHWNRSICRALGAKSKLGLMDGILPEPSVTCVTMRHGKDIIYDLMLDN